MRKPTNREYLEFTGLHCSVKWRALSDSWRCPSCGRTKRELMRWGKRTGVYWIKHYGLYGWRVSLADHHDHGDRWPGTVLICGGCNGADDVAKRKLGLPESWSFTADEISRFVTAAPNGSVTVDVEKALSVYREATNVIPCNGKSTPNMPRNKL